MSTDRRLVNVVPHTHWDREWYEPQPVFRMRLVDLLDGLLPILEAGDGYDHFQLDGQMAAVDDYLEIRPQEGERLADLNRSGRLSMGPWYTLPDEFLVSGETLVRDLALGFADAERFGGSMAVGYLPDMFGHVAQMPQILAGFGLRDAVVWRGIPSVIEAPAFDWEAPDGTVVRAEYLSDGYSNGARLPSSGVELAEQVAAFCENQGPLVGDPVLWMNGTDHLLPQPWLGRVVQEANDGQDRFRFVVTSLAGHLASVGDEDRPAWRGELRSGARTNLLMGVASCRIDVKQAAARAERWLERVAEPLGTLWFPPEAWPGPFLDLAWREVIRNAAHDSICGCSADEVNDAVLHRYAEATRVAEGVTDRALVRALAASGQDAIVVNPTARRRSATISTVISGDVAPPQAQQVSVRPEVVRTEGLTTTAAVPVVVRAAMEDPRVSTVSIEPVDGATDEWLAEVVADRRPKAVDAVALRQELEALAHDHPDGVVHLELHRPSATQEVLLRTTVDGFGWRGLAPEDLGATAVRTEGLGLTNGIVTVVVDQADGTFTLTDEESYRQASGLGRLVDDGDAGDTYNWSPPAEDLVVERPDDVEVTVTEAGPVRGRIQIDRTFRWPTQVADDHRVGEVEVLVTTVVELHAGEDLVRVEVSFDNRARDHRLRLHLPLPEPAEASVAECAFTTVTRGLEAEGGPNEAALPTFPSRRFVAAGGLLVVHDGLPEYELVDIDDGLANEVAITLMRSVGIISRGPMRMRALPAGPPTPTPAAQMPGLHRARLAIHLGDRDPYAVADDAFTPILTARRPAGSGLGDPEAGGWELSVEGAEVTALRRRGDGRRELRVFNPTDAETTLAVATPDGPASGQVTDLRGAETGVAFGGSVDLRPHQILTLALDA